MAFTDSEIAEAHEAVRAGGDCENLYKLGLIYSTGQGILDALLVLALLGGIGIPAGHMTMKWLCRKYRARSGGKDAG